MVHGNFTESPLLLLCDEPVIVHSIGSGGALGVQSVI